ncbi:endonuclease/exonuclease/phosphatase family protein [Parapedobacter soli]|uniref:endonuclease/exonuclease/phosphatase family protein n=1 Tax=Parapedobacter soli TaxID=416955 RepID=UPI0021C663F5|nr:endonuclease/exonuclease/phosphatase family protein [Parapedobacter soli]
MKHRIIRGLMFLMLVAHAAGAQPGARSAQPLKVMSYNVYNGFDYGRDKARAQALGAWVASQQPDVVALQELCGFTDKTLQELAATWGHDYAVILKADGFPVGLTSNKPITVKKKMIEGLWHGMLHVTTHGTDFFVVHLCPSDFATRLRESARITRYMRKNLSLSNEKYVVLGDFNAHSPFDAHLDKQYPELMKWYNQLDAERKPKTRQTLSYGQLDYSVMATFLAFPLIDVCERFVDGSDRFSFPSPLHFNPVRTRESLIPIRERLDFILVSPSLATQCTDATIVNTGVADAFSDHYPVIATFALGN